MVKKESGRIRARETTLAVMKILIDTQNTGPISIIEIVDRLAEKEEIITGRDTVKAILHDLQEHWPIDGEVKCEEKTKNNGQTYTYSYFYQPLQSDPIQAVIQKINQIIQKNKKRVGYETTLSFWFNGYGSDKKIHHVGRQYEDVLPVRVSYSNGHAYLICFWKDKKEPAHMRVDLITELKTNDTKKMDAPTRNLAFNASDTEYRQQHPYMFYEKEKEFLRHITIRIKKNPSKPHASLTFLHDVFGDSWNVVAGTETDEYVNVIVNCYPHAVSQFVWQFIDCVEVIEPLDIKSEIESSLTHRFETAMFMTEHSK